MLAAARRKVGRVLDSQSYATVYQNGEEYGFGVGPRYDLTDPKRDGWRPVFCTPIPETVEAGKDAWYAVGLVSRVRDDRLADADLEGVVLQE